MYIITYKKDKYSIKDKEFDFKTGQIYKIKPDINHFNTYNSLHNICLYTNYKPNLQIFKIKKIKNNTFEVTHKISFKDYLNQVKDNLKFDKNNNLIYYKDSKNFERWYKYDENNNLIHYKDSDNYEYWKEYDKNNNLIYLKDSKNFEYWKEYDENNNLTHYKTSYNIEEWYKYDNNNNIIHFKNNNYEYWKEYDNNNNCIFFKDKNKTISIFKLTPVKSRTQILDLD